MGLRIIVDKFMPYLLAPERYRSGLARLAEVVHFGGHTTIGDMATGLFNMGMEWEATKAALDNEQTPFRVELVTDGHALTGPARGNPAALDLITSRPEPHTPHTRFRNNVKTF